MDTQSQEVTPYDIILNKVSPSPEMIPNFINILIQYEKECGQNARYVEAEMAKHKIEDLRKMSKILESEKINNTHLKEKIEVEEAYLEEMAKFKAKWAKKQAKFEKKVDESKIDMINYQKA